MTQLERRSTNKRILCPGWLPCKLQRTLLRPLFVLKHTEDAERPLQHKAADNGRYYTHSNCCLINAVGKVLIAVLDSWVFSSKSPVVCFKWQLWNEIKSSLCQHGGYSGHGNTWRKINLPTESLYQCFPPCLCPVTEFSRNKDEFHPLISTSLLSQSLC